MTAVLEALRRPTPAARASPTLLHRGAPAPLVSRALRDPGRGLGTAERTFMQRRFGFDFGAVRIHTDGEAARSAGAIGALAYTVGPDIVFGSGRYQPDTPDGERLLAHELGHVVEHQRNEGGDSAPQTLHCADAAAATLASRPEEERRRVRVLDKRLSSQGVAIIESFFLPSRSGGPGPSAALPQGVDVEVGPSIPAALRAAFVSAAASLATPSTGASQAFLEPDSTIELAIAPTGLVARFTRVTRAASAAGGATEVVLVESAGPIPRAPAPEPSAEPRDPAGDRPREASGTLPYKQAADLVECVRIMGEENSAYCRHEVLGEPLPRTSPAPTQLGKTAFKVHTHRFTRGPGWRSDQWEMVVAAIELLPEPALSAIEGERFERAAKKECKPDQVTAKTCDPELAGETHAVEHRITIFDNAFTASTTRFGLANRLTDVVAHEVGHQAAYAPLGAAYGRYQATPSAGEKKLLAARSRSGERFEIQIRSGKKVYWTVDAAKDVTPEFRQASIQDGLQVDPSGKITGRGITEYGQKSWEELYAESFAEYVLDPDLLQALRPHVFRYMAKLYPQP